MVYIVEIPHECPPEAWSSFTETEALEAINSRCTYTGYSDLEEYREDYDGATCHIFYNSEDAREFVKMAEAGQCRNVGRSGDDGSIALEAELDLNDE